MKWCGVLSKAISRSCALRSNKFWMWLAILPDGLHLQRCRLSGLRMGTSPTSDRLATAFPNLRSILDAGYRSTLGGTATGSLSCSRVARRSAGNKTSAAPRRTGKTTGAGRPRKHTMALTKDFRENDPRTRSTETPNPNLIVRRDKAKRKGGRPLTSAGHRSAHQRHKSEIHMELLMAVKQRRAGAHLGDVGLDHFVGWNPDHVLEEARRGLAINGG